MDEIENLAPKDVQKTLIFFVNGKKVIEHKPDPEWTLLWYLRRKLQLTGTKYGCGEGGCGACTVMVSQYLKQKEHVKHIAINACLTNVCAIHGLAITTVEGIGSTRDRLHPVQERIAKAHGSQCGFCTPGIVMSMYTLLRNKQKIEYNDLDVALQGNLCRCTGYRPIIEAYKTFTEGWKNNSQTNSTCIMGKECCQNKQQKINDNELFDTSSFLPYDASQEPIFPPELKLNIQLTESYLFFKGESVTWIRPRNLEELLQIKAKCPFGKIVAGNTEIGIEIKFKNRIYPLLISPVLIPEMSSCYVTETGIKIGAAVSLTDLLSYLQNDIKDNETRSRIFNEIKDMLHWFAGSQVRNVATLTGNIITASPISDLNPILMACSAILNVCSLDRGCRRLTIDETFFKGYRKTTLEDDEVVLSIEIPYTADRQFVKAYKQARRRDDDISIVTAAFNITLKKESNVVLSAKICYGGMGPTTICTVKSSKILIGRQWDQNMLNDVFNCLTDELVLDISAPGGMVDYRKSLCLSLFFKFYLYVSLKINNRNGSKVYNEISGADGIPMMLSTSSQCFQIENLKSYAVGKPIPHASAMKQATGEAIYCDDIPHTDGELFLSLIFSDKSFARIISIDPSKALSVPGVVTFFSAKDLDDNCNKLGPLIKDEQIFYKEMVTSRSCVIGAIVAESEAAAKKAKNLVNIVYEPLEPILVSIEDAIKHRSYFSSSPITIKKGNVNEVFSKSNNIVEGKARIGAQEHFYLETLSAYAVPKEDELEITASTQSPGEIAKLVSHALRIPNHKIVTKVKRIGGGFGGKETRSAILILPVAIAAYKLKKPVRAVLDRDEDMQVTGYRHPFLINYKVAFNENGKITAAVFNLYANAGYSMDISCSVIEKATFHIDNCYYIPNVEVNGYICKTNIPSNTAFRGFGAPQAMFGAEIMMRHVASALGKSYEEIVTVNLYSEGSKTHFNQTLTYCTLPRCWNECVEKSDYWRRKKIVAEFNRSNRWKKKGIALVPTKFGISFHVDILMQAGALLLVYSDGSVLISIGGIEMGQGLFTKMVQIASNTLEIDYNKIYISESATDKVPNSTATAASLSSDMYGMAVIDACDILKNRIAPYKVNDPTGTWEDWVLKAYADRVSLFATGFYAAPKIEYNRETNSGNMFEYFTYGVACSEVIIDCLTGDHQVLRTDIVMDVGESLNPAIDIGQIEGAFMQGYGLLTLEELVFSPSGETLSRGPGTYKIPAFSDIPKEFNVSLLKGAPNPRAVYSSKAIGEPPLFLAASVFFAIKDAISSARTDGGLSPDFILDSPATCARIRMACEDDITKQVKTTKKQNGSPWNVIA